MNYYKEIKRIFQKSKIKPIPIKTILDELEKKGVERGLGLELLKKMEQFGMAYEPEKGKMELF